MGYALELVAATVPPEVPHQVGTPLIGTRMSTCSPIPPRLP
jgi:hypothetical protein